MKVRKHKFAVWIEFSYFRFLKNGILRGFIQCLFLIVTFFFALASLVIRYRWDPDANHDGGMFTPALAFANGQLPNKDFFSLYGPITPALQGTWLRLFGINIFQLRMFTVFLVTVTAIIAFHSIKRNFGVYFSALVCTVWVMTGPVGLPWSSNITSLLVILSFMLVKEAQTLEFLGRKTQRNLLLGFSSFILVSCTLIRIHLILSFLIALPILVYYKKRKDIGQIAISWVAGGLLAFTLWFLILIRLRILNPYIQQSIIWTANFFSVPRLDRAYFLNVLWYPFVTTVTVLLIFSVKVLYRKGLPNRLTHLLASLIFSVPFMVFLYLSRFNTDSFRSLFDIHALVLFGSKWMLFAFDYSVVTIGILVTGYLVIQKLRLARGNQFFYEVLIVGIAISCLSQLYPLYDRFHLWFITPIFIVAFAPILHSHIKQNPRLKKSLTLCLSMLFLILSLQFVLDARIPKYEYKNVSMQKLESDSQNAKEMDASMLMLEKYAVAGKVKFICPVGIYSSAGSKYLSYNGDYINWGDFFTNEKKSFSQVFICETSLDKAVKYLKDGFYIKSKSAIHKMDYDTRIQYWNILLEKIPSK